MSPFLSGDKICGELRAGGRKRAFGEGQAVLREVPFAKKLALVCQTATVIYPVEEERTENAVCHPNSQLPHLFIQALLHCTSLFWICTLYPFPFAAITNLYKLTA